MVQSPSTEDETGLKNQMMSTTLEKENSRNFKREINPDSPNKVLDFGSPSSSVRLRNTASLSIKSVDMAKHSMQSGSSDNTESRIKSAFEEFFMMSLLTYKVKNEEKDKLVQVS